jgi:hypothetical protein
MIFVPALTCTALSMHPEISVSTGIIKQERPLYTYFMKKALTLLEYPGFSGREHEQEFMSGHP